MFVLVFLCIGDLLSLTGLSSYSVHTGATEGPFREATKNPETTKMGIFCVPLTIRVKILQTIGSGYSHISYHIFHINLYLYTKTDPNKCNECNENQCIVISNTQVRAKTKHFPEKYEKVRPFFFLLLSDKEEKFKLSKIPQINIERLLQFGNRVCFIFLDLQFLRAFDEQEKEIFLPIQQTFLL